MPTRVCESRFPHACQFSCRNVIKITYPDSYYVEREYDELNRLKSISLNGSMTPALEFDYDELSRRRQITADNTVVTEYGYRADNQLESIEHTFDGASVLFEYTFNDAGECIGQEVDDADFMWHPPSSGTVTYATAADNNTYPTVGGISQSYNNNGCLTDDGTWTFGYDTENHLISATDGVTSATYLYDPMHRLVQKEVGATKTRFVYTGVQRLADYNGSNDTLQYRYVYGTSLDEVLMRISSGGTITYMHADRAGSIVATSDNTGDNTAKFKYGPFGETSALSGISHGYTGQRFDEETGLYFMKSRFYSPVIGRFLQPDTIGYVGGLNLYCYVQNAPLDFSDPLGLAGEPHGYIPGLGYNLPYPIWGPGGGGSSGIGEESRSTVKSAFGGGVGPGSNEEATSSGPYKLAVRQNDDWLARWTAYGKFLLLNPNFGLWYDSKYARGLLPGYTWKQINDGKPGVITPENFRHEYGKQALRLWLSEVAHADPVYEEIQFFTSNGNPIADFVFKFEGMWMIGEVKTNHFSKADSPKYTDAQTTGYPNISAGDYFRTDPTIPGMAAGLYVPVLVFYVNFGFGVKVFPFGKPGG